MSIISFKFITKNYSSEQEAIIDELNIKKPTPDFLYDDFLHIINNLFDFFQHFIYFFSSFICIFN